MHVVVGLITALAGLIWALNRLQNSGVDLNSFNPFTWYRRHQWKKKLNRNPLYNLSSSMEVGSVLIFGMAKLSGEITRETKQEIMKIYGDTFNLSEQDASDLYSHSSFLTRDIADLPRVAKRIISESKDPFTDAQVQSLVGILEKVAKIESEPNKMQMDYLEVIKRTAQPSKKVNW